MQRNKFEVGDEIEFLRQKGSSISIKVTELYDEDMNPVESAPHPKQILYLKTDVPVKKYDMLRKAAE